ncbi:hypothetical protein [Sorangium sp. So ce1151]|uniref:hypothetical protein n=1 Tax=Sorangium sp. So ce1151 TaxID=3133332 RepID=UPI003F639C2F
MRSASPIESIRTPRSTWAEWLGPSVTDEDLALLESLTAGVYVEGKATKRV